LGLFVVNSAMLYFFSHVNRKTQYEHPGANAIKKSATAGK